MSPPERRISTSLGQCYRVDTHAPSSPPARFGPQLQPERRAVKWGDATPGVRRCQAERPRKNLRMSGWEMPRVLARGVPVLLVLGLVAGCHSDSSPRATSETSSVGAAGVNDARSEERRVGKECRSGWEAVR